MHLLSPVDAMDQGTIRQEIDPVFLEYMNFKSSSPMISLATAQERA